MFYVQEEYVIQLYDRTTLEGRENRVETPCESLITRRAKCHLMEDVVAYVKNKNAIFTWRHVCI